MFSFIFAIFISFQRRCVYIGYNETATGVKSTQFQIYLHTVILSPLQNGMHVESFGVDGATIFLLGIMNSLVCNFSTYTEYSIGFYYIFMMPTAIQNDCLARKQWCNTRRLCEQCIIWKRFSQACVIGESTQAKKACFLKRIQVNPNTFERTITLASFQQMAYITFLHHIQIATNQCRSEVHTQ